MQHRDAPIGSPWTARRRHVHVAAQIAVFVTGTSPAPATTAGAYTDGS
jgi:hypothetical protein